MPNIKSAIKRVSVNATKQELNKGVRTKILTYTKKFKLAVEQKDFENAEKLYCTVASVLDKAAQENVISKNSASRRKGHLASFLANAKNA